MKRFLLISWRVLRSVAVFGGLFLLLALWAMRLSWVQNQVVPIVENELEKAIGTEVSVGEVDLSLPANAVLRDLTMFDQKGQRMFAVKEFRLSLASFSLLKLIFSPSSTHQFSLNHIDLIHPEAHLYKSRADSTLNLDFLTQKKDTVDKGEPMSFELFLRRVRIHGGVFSYIDSTKHDSVLAETGRINFDNLRMRNLNTEFDLSLYEDQRIAGNIRHFRVTEHRSHQMINEFRTEFLMVPDFLEDGQMRMCFENSQMRAGRNLLDFDGELDMIPASKVPPPEDSLELESWEAQPRIEFAANLRPTVLDFHTVNYLLKKSLPMRDPLQLDGYVYGDMNGIYSDSLHIGLYDKTRLNTAARLVNFTKNEDLAFQADITEGIVSFEELQRFLPRTDVPLKGLAGVRGTLIGDLDRLKTNNFVVRYMKDTDLFVKATLNNYTKGDELMINAKFRDSHFSFAELRQLLPSMQFPDWMNRFGRCAIEGKFLGGPTDFVVKSDVTTGYGNMFANMHVQLPPKVKEIGYNGWIETDRLNFAALEADLPVTSRYFNFKGEIEGHGTKWGEAVATISGRMSRSDIDGYHIDTLYTDSLKIDRYTIAGRVDMHDKEGNASLTVNVDLSDSLHKYKIDGDVTDLDLAHYDIVPNDSIQLTTIMNVHFQGDSIENYTGAMRFFFVDMHRRGTEDSLQIPGISLKSKLDGYHRKLTLKSSIVRMDARGDFSYKKAGTLIGRLAKEGKIYIQNRDSVIAKYYATKMLEPEDITIHDTITTKRGLNDVLTFFQVPMQFKPGTKVFLELEHGIADIVKIKMLADSFSVSNMVFRGDSMTMEVFKDGTQNSLIGAAEVYVDTFIVGKNLKFMDVQFTPTADDRQVDYRLKAAQPSLGNRYEINAQTDFYHDGTIITSVKPLESSIVIKGKTWRFQKGNKIERRFEHPPSLGPSHPDSLIARYHVKKLSLVNEGQEFVANGVVSKDFTDQLFVAAKDVKIHSLLEITETPMDLDGVVRSATASAYSLLTEQPTIGMRADVEDLRYKNVDSLGLRIQGGWPSSYGPDYAYVTASLGHFGKDSVNVEGSYNVRHDSLDFYANESSILLEWLSPFMEGVLSDMEGKVAVDDFTITGTTKRPILHGLAHLTNTSFKVDYLNNDFVIGDNVLDFDNEKLTIKDMMVKDTADGSALLHGFVYYNDTNGVRLDLDMENILDLQCLDTRKHHKQPFYGKIILAGDSASISGTINRPVVEAWVTTGEGSWMDIPLEDYTSASRLDFVNFVRDSIVVDTTSDITGFNMTLTVNAKPNTKVRLIFDEQVGDIIEATGDGTITMKIDEDGGFNMFGAYIIDEGNYLFTAENIVNKKFIVEKGGRITWNGPAYEANVDLEAVYKVNADASALLGGSSIQRVPVDVVMKMLGSLESPEISLELRLDQLSEQDVMGLASYFRGIQYDQQELNKQVVSLLIFRRFTRSSSTTQAGAGGVTSSISELISNQVNYWISQAFQEANVDLEVNTNQFQDVELALRTTLLNEKITVERNGTIIGNTGSSFSIGDLSVLIKLLPSTGDSTKALKNNPGQLVMEIFNREDISLNTANNVSRGVGVFYKKDFDRIRFRGGKPVKGDMKQEEGVE